jgi:hypothetical protein
VPLEDTRADGTDRRGTPGWVARPQAGPPPVPRPPNAAAHDGAHLDVGTDVRTEIRTDVPRDGRRGSQPAPVLQPDVFQPDVFQPADAVPSADAFPPADPFLPAAAALPAETASAGVRRRSPAAWVVACLLVVVLLAAGALSAYLWRSTDAWRASSAGWEVLARESASQLATTQEELATAQDELTETKVQLATAQDRITELADEKAQLGDDSAAQQQLADYQARVSQAAGQVATALATCIDGQQQLIEYMEAADQYDAAELERFRDDVDTLCAQATDANTQLQTELEQ